MMKNRCRHIASLLVVLLAADHCLGDVGPRVETALLASDWPGVIDALEADESTAGDPVACMVLSMVYEAEARLEESNSAYRTAAEHGDMLKTWSEWTVRFLDRHQKAPVALWFAADANIMKGDHEAREQLDRAIKIDREFIPAYFCQARYYKAIGEPKKAAEMCGKVIKLRPDHTKAYLERGTLYLRIGKEKDAIKDFDRLLELDPTHSLGLQRRGNAHLARDEYEDALADYTSALELTPGEAMLHNNIGQVYYHMKDYDRAMSELAGVLADSTDQDGGEDSALARGYAFTTIGRIHEEQGDFTRAISDYTSAIELAPNHSVAYTQRGLIYLQQLDDEERACADFRRACELGSCNNYRAGVQKGMCE